jgi:glutathione S-transferase
MEKHLATRRFFAADRYSIADIALYAYTHLAHQCDYNLAGFPAVRDWLSPRRGPAGHVAMDWQPAGTMVAAAVN